MTEELQQALILEASKLKAKAIDGDVFKALVPEEIDAKDSEAVEKAVKKAVEQHPSLFQVEKPWSALSEDEFQQRERAFRESLRKSHSVGPNQYAALDAALLSPEELQSLTRLLGGRGSSWDRSICERALAEQRQLLGGQ